MNRCFYVCLVLIPLLFALSLVIFSISTEYWTKIDYGKLKNSPDATSSRRDLKLKKVKFEFPKYTSLFGECDEYKLVDIWVPRTDFISADGENERSRQEVFNQQQLEDNHTVSSSAARQIIFDETGCMNRQKCNELNELSNNTCFCCTSGGSDGCCYLKSNLCDGVSNCRDRSDEANCPTKKLFFANQYYDNKYNCLRHQYNLFDFVKNVYELNILKMNKSNPNSFCFFELIKLNNYAARIFVVRTSTLLCLFACILFTVFSILAIIFVSCCNDLKPKKKKLSYDDSNGFNYGLGSEDDYETVSLKTQSSCCCKCNCLPCPFVFYSFFTFLALLACLAALGAYLYSVYLFRMSLLIYDVEYTPAYITQAYQYNAWLFDVISYDLSFYSMLIACAIYLFTFILSTCVTCHIQMSPAWRRRHTDSYEVLEMHDFMMNNGGPCVNGGQNSGSKKNTYKKLAKEAGQCNGSSSKEDKKAIKKRKKSSEKQSTINNMPINGANIAVHDPNDDDNISMYDEAQTLTAPKTRIASIDN